jgi:hypothetical protein
MCFMTFAQFISRPRQDSLSADPLSCLIWTAVCLLEVKWPEFEGNNSCPSSAEVYLQLQSSVVFNLVQWQF